MASNESEFEKLKRLSMKLQELLNSDRNFLAYDEVLASNTEWLTTHYIKQELEDISILLQLIIDSFIDLQKNTKERQLEFQEGNFRYFQLFDEFNFLTKSIPTHIRSIYHRLYSISDLLGKSNKTRNLIDSSTQDSLDRHLLYRHKIVVHKKISSILTGARIFNPNGSFRIMPGAFLSDEGHQLIDSLFGDARAVLPEADKGLINSQERLTALYRSYHNLSRPQKKQFSTLMEQFGVASAQPHELAEVSVDIARDLFGKGD